MRERQKSRKSMRTFCFLSAFSFGFAFAIDAAIYFVFAVS